MKVRARWAAASILGTVALTLAALADRLIGIPPGMAERHHTYHDD